MYDSLRVTVALLAVLTGLTGVAKAADEKTPVSVIFETPHLEKVSRGDQLSYRFQHTVSDERVLGPSYADAINFSVDKVAADGKRDVTIRVFTGGRARDPFSEPRTQVNPVLAWYFNQSVNLFQNMSGGGQFEYLKGKFSHAFRDKAKLEETTAEYQGRQIPALRITVTPYDGDPNAKKMDGYEKSDFQMLVSPEVPGYVIELVSNIKSTKRLRPGIEEKITLVSVGGAQ